MEANSKEGKKMTEDQRQVVIFESANQVSNDLLTQAMNSFRDHLMSLNPEIFNRHEVFNLATATLAMLAVKLSQEVTRLMNQNCDGECEHAHIHPDMVLQSTVQQMSYFKNKLILEMRVMQKH